MTLRSTFLRARWLLLLVPLFALASTMQVGCAGSSDRQDDYAREDVKPGGNAGGASQYGGLYDDGYGYGNE